MTIEDKLARLRALMEEWPCGSVVYHRADGKRGVIGGHVVHDQGDVGLRVDYGADSWSTETASHVTTTRPGDDSGDDWREEVAA